MKNFKPLRAPSKSLKPSDFPNLKKYPYYASRKEDGIRCVIVDGNPLTRTLKPIRNDHIRNSLQGFPALDGELMLKTQNGERVPFELISSAVMSKDGTPDFEFVVFDCFEIPEYTTTKRLERAKMYVAILNVPFVRFLPQTLVKTPEELANFEQQCIDLGLEGSMIRAADSVYKFGTSTLNESALIKCKRFNDDEAIITGFVERFHNNNEAYINEAGYTKRSTCKENKIGANTLGALICDWKGIEITVDGFNDETRQRIWDNQSEYLGKPITFSYQELTKLGVPRFAKYKSLRDPSDIL